VELLDFYTAVLRQSDGYWVSLCLENGVVGQGTTQDNAIASLRDAIASLQDVYTSEPDAYRHSPLSVEELHEFLQLETLTPISETYELRAISA
jgi:predicted RNase H-like HicB family nuclease